MEQYIKTRYEITEEQLEEFEKLLRDNPINENQQIQNLLSRPKRWEEK